MIPGVINYLAALRQSSHIQFLVVDTKSKQQRERIKQTRVSRRKTEYNVVLFQLVHAPPHHCN